MSNEFHQVSCSIRPAAKARGPLGPFIQQLLFCLSPFPCFLCSAAGGPLSFLIPPVFICMLVYMLCGLSRGAPLPWLYYDFVLVLAVAAPASIANPTNQLNVTALAFHVYFCKCERYRRAFILFSGIELEADIARDQWRHQYVARVRRTTYVLVICMK